MFRINVNKRVKQLRKKIISLISISDEDSFAIYSAILREIDPTIIHIYTDRAFLKKSFRQDQRVDILILRYYSDPSTGEPKANLDTIINTNTLRIRTYKFKKNKRIVRWISLKKYLDEKLKRLSKAELEKLWFKML